MKGEKRIGKPVKSKIFPSGHEQGRVDFVTYENTQYQREVVSLTSFYADIV